MKKTVLSIIKYFKKVFNNKTKKEIRMESDIKYFFDPQELLESFKFELLKSNSKDRSEDSVKILEKLLKITKNKDDE